MPRALVNASADTPIEVEYETFGSPSDPALLLIMGLGAQLTAWPDELCAELVAAGHHVIRFDNRDVGLSTKLDGAEVDLATVMMAALAEIEVPAVPYTLSDMAADAVGLLDHLGIDRAHIVGASLGGMIAQTVAIEHPQRCLSLVSIMSQPGDPDVGQPTPEAFTVLVGPPPTTREEYVATAPRWMVWHSRKYRDEAMVKEIAGREFDRSFYPQGGQRQLAAIFASGRRAAQLAELQVPTLVIHGTDDTLITPDGGVRTAELIPGANLLLVADMGHDLPAPLLPLLADAIKAHCLHAVRLAQLV